MQTTAIRTVANSLPENEVILLTLLISKRYIPYTDLHKIFGLSTCDIYKFTFFNSEDTHVVIKHILLENVLFDYMKCIISIR